MQCIPEARERVNKFFSCKAVADLSIKTFCIARAGNRDKSSGPKLLKVLKIFALKLKMKYFKYF